MGNLDRKAYDAKIRCLATFYSQTTVLAHRVIASTITTLVAANRGVHFLAPFIPRELMSLPNNPSDAEPPGAPACSNDYQMDVRVHCLGMDVSVASLTVLVRRWFGLHLRWPSQTRKQANALLLLPN